MNHFQGTIPNDVRNLLGFSEKVLLTVEADCTVFATDKRLILKRSQVFGLRKHIDDYPYGNIANIKMTRGITRSAIELLMNTGMQPLKIHRIPNKLIYELHRILRNNASPLQDNAQPAPVSVILQSSGPNEFSKSKLKLCENCGSEIDSKFNLCPFCGFGQRSKCPGCQQPVDSKFKICPFCGDDLADLGLIDEDI